MPYKYFIDSRRELVFSWAVGVFSNEDMAQHSARLKLEPSFKPTFRHFADFSGVTDFTGITKEGISSVAVWPVLFDHAAVRAAYVPQTALFGMVRMFASMREAPTNGLVTRDRAEAERHVGLSAGESEELLEKLSRQIP